MVTVDLDIRKLNLKDTFHVFLTEDDETETYKNIEELCIYGINIYFDICDYLDNLGRAIVIKDKIGKVIIKRKVYDLSEFREELRSREKLMKKWLIQKLENKSIASIRGT